MASLFEDFNTIQNQAANQYKSANNPITKGSLISFEYSRSFSSRPGIIHDPRPMLIVTDIVSGSYIRGVNLHYLTLPFVKKMIENWSGNTNFSYSTIKSDDYISNAFRMYYLKGVRNPKRLDSEWLKTVLQSSRSFDAGEIEKIRANIQQQIQARLQVKANELNAREQMLNQQMQQANQQFVQNNFSSFNQNNTFTTPSQDVSNNNLI